jgi:hypothetical protein
MTIIDPDAAEEIQIRHDLSKQVLTAFGGHSIAVIIDVMAYAMAHTLTQMEGLSNTEVMDHFNTRVRELHRIIMEDSDDHTCH